jgi:hypothetical protein
MVTSLSKLLDHNGPFEFESDNKTVEVEIDLQLSMQEKFAIATDKEINSKISSKSRTTKDVTSILKKELAIFEVEGKRGAVTKILIQFHLVVWNQNVFFRMWKNCCQN